MNQHISVANKYTSKIKKGNVSDKLFVLLYTKEKEPLSSGGDRVTAVRRANWLGEQNLDSRPIIKENLL